MRVQAGMEHALTLLIVQAVALLIVQAVKLMWNLFSINPLFIFFNNW